MGYLKRALFKIYSVYKCPKLMAHFGCSFFSFLARNILVEQLKQSP